MERGRRQEFLAGVWAEVPICLGVIPFGMVYGVVAMAAGLSKDVALAMSTIVFAGSAQFLAVQLIQSGAAAWVIATSTLVVNLRHVLYGFSIGPSIRALPARWKCLLANLLTDEAYAVTVVRYCRAESQQRTRGQAHWYFLGAGVTLWATWQLSTLVGVLLGRQVPSSWSLDFALPLTFIALVIPGLAQRAEWTAALAAGVVAVLAAGMPFRLGLMVGALVGIATGVLVDPRSGAASETGRA
jgi:4-azaleucine resistance transporter AzlC